MYFLLSKKAARCGEFASKLFPIFEVDFTLSIVWCSANVSWVPTLSPTQLSCKVNAPVSQKNDWKVISFILGGTPDLPRPDKGDNLSKLCGKIYQQEQKLVYMCICDHYLFQNENSHA